jgi:hypothetical protein
MLLLGALLQVLLFLCLVLVLLPVVETWGGKSALD